MKLTKSLAISSAVVSLAAPVAMGQAPLARTTVWNAGADGLWSGANWDNGVPTSDSLPGIETPWTVTVASAASTDLAQLYMDGGATLNVDAAVGVAATVTTPTPNGIWVKTGTININSGGTLSSTGLGEVRLGQGANVTAAVNLAAGGTFTTDGRVELGREGNTTATFTQTDGTLTHTGDEFRVGLFGAVGTYDISGGTATINTLKSGYAGTGDGTVNISGTANVTLNGTTSIGWGGDSSGEINVSGGTVGFGQLRIGVAGSDSARTATFDQTGGTVTSASRVEIGTDCPAAMDNTYQISAGTMNVDRVEVGDGSNATGTFKVSGTGDANIGVVSVAREANSTGTLELTGGDLTASTEVTIGQNQAATASATMNISDAGYLETGNLRIRNATVNHSGGDVYVTTPGGGFLVGLDSGADCTYNMSGGLITSDTRLRLAVNTTGAVLFDQTGGDVDITGRLDLVQNGGTNNVYQISGGTLTTSAEAFIGAYSTGTATFNVSGTAVVDIGSELDIGREDTVGIVNLSGGTTDATIIDVGDRGAANTGTGELNITMAAALNGTGIRVRNGVVTQSDTSVVTLTGESRIGYDNTVDATYNLEGGTITSGNRIRMGGGSHVRTNLFNQTGGTVELTGATKRIDIGEGSGEATNIYQISGGTLDLNGGDVMVGAFNQGSGIFTVSGDAVVDTGRVRLGRTTLGNPGTDSILNLDGGTLIVDTIQALEAGPGPANLNLDGGTIQARANASLIANGSNLTIDVKAGGVTIDTEGFDCNLYGDFAGVGGLTKEGGTPSPTDQLKIHGNCTYQGDTTVNEGSLTVLAPGSLTFTIGAHGVNNQVTGNGTGTLNLFGPIAFDLSGAAVNGTWTIVDTANLAGYNRNASFAVTGWTDAGGDIWTINSGGADYSFNAATGILTVGDGGGSVFDSWAAAKGLDGTAGKENGTADDPDQGGKDNLFEFGFNGDPLDPSNEGLLYSLVADSDVDGDSDPELLLTVAVRTGASFTAGMPATSAAVDGIIYSVGGSAGLPVDDSVTVNVATTPVVPAGAPDLSGNPDYEYKTFSLAGSTGTLATGFMQATVEEE